MKSQELRKIQTEFFAQLFRQAERESENFKIGIASKSNSITGVAHSATAFYLSAYYRKHPSTMLVITKSEKEANQLQSDLKVFLEESEVGFYPDLNVLPYEDISPSRFSFFNRIDALYRLSEAIPSVVVSSVQAASRFILELETFKSHVLELSISKKYARDDLTGALQRLGYSSTARVTEIGEYSLRGEILDIFSSAYTSPVRIEFFDDEVEAIRLFHADTQVSFEQLKSMKVLPKKDTWISHDRLLDKLSEMEDVYTGTPGFEDFAEKVKLYGAFSGFHQYLPLFTDEKTTLLDYATTKTEILLDGGWQVIDKLELLREEYEKFFHEKSKAGKFKLKPDSLFLNMEEMKQQLLPFNVETLTPLKKSEAESFVHLFFDDPTNYKSELKKITDEIGLLIQKEVRVVLLASHAEQVRRLAQIFEELNPACLFHHDQDRQEARLTLSSPFVIVQANLSRGFDFPEGKIKFICENEIFGRKKKVSRHFGEDASRVLESFLDLKEKDHVVHMNHGIGVYQGLKRLSIKGKTKDFLKIEYADKANLFIPVEQINLIQKYIGSGGSGQIKVDHLGGKAWDKLKNRVKKSVEDIAKDLIVLYSKRNEAEKIPFPSDTPWQAQFEADFPFEETPDQLKAIEELKRDMESVKPMDRLICGDVGFGKTEVAMRAAFKATMDSRQVILLCPTTILSQQHYHTFQERFVNYPVNIEVINRFKSAKEQKLTLEKVQNGKVDILIGTHRLLSKDVVLKKLGLLIIDEEQKFGVKHKEKIRELATEVDTIALSATPIPRSLHMSLINIRTINVMMTPPMNRLPVQTFVMEMSEQTIVEAVNREINRQGQIYFLHNRVETIAQMAIYLRKICPSIKIAVAHGQMNEVELEQIMNEFIARKHDLLLATTIIDSGLDIPNANTIFINNADFFGLSQLYQLRGRVGRSVRQAYAYFFHAQNKALSEDAMKRLRSISEYVELGSGFKIAMKDLEIRGAGNVLGKEQSGNIMAVGFDMYCQLLEEAIGDLQPEKEKPRVGSVIDIKYDGFIPDDYIPDGKEKIEVYKKISSIRDDETYQKVEAELHDRFGKMPAVIHRLFEISKLRVRAEEVGFFSMIEKLGKLEIKLAKQNKISFDKIMARMQNKRDVFPDTQDALAFHVDLPAIEDEVETEDEFESKLDFIRNFIQSVTE